MSYDVTTSAVTEEMDIALDTHRSFAMGVFLLVELLADCWSRGVPVSEWEKEPKHHGMFNE